MARILCIDTEPETIRALRDFGHTVESGDIGYRTGAPRLSIPPHEFDLIACDLRKPACFDRLKWGEGRNDNYRAIIEPEVRDEQIRMEGTVVPRFQLIKANQLRAAPPENFGPNGVLKAIAAGTPAIIFLNPEWVRHVSPPPPNFFGVFWQFRRTIATQLILSATANRLVPELDDKVSITRPVTFAIEKGPVVMERHEVREPIPLVTNRIDDVFGQAVRVGRGIVMAVPSLDNNALFVNLLADRFVDFQQLDRLFAPAPTLRGSHPRVVPDMEKDKPSEQRMAAESDEGRPVKDVFISYASEDRETVARPIADALIARGLSVWFDEYELQIGDSLRRKIEQGLAASRFGVAILSRKFFQKPWPQRELSALFALEGAEPRILPVWHDVTAEDIKKVSPLMADKYGIPFERGVDVVADAIHRKVSGKTAQGRTSGTRLAQATPAGEVREEPPDLPMDMRTFKELIAPEQERQGFDVALVRPDRLFRKMREGWEPVIEQDPQGGRSGRVVIMDNARVDLIAIRRRRVATP